MCGIVGAYHLGAGSLDPCLLLRANQIMRHRGPDDEGYLLMHTASGWHSLRNGPDTAPGIHHRMVDAPTAEPPDLILAHRRLAILDTSAGGHEPMTIGDGRLWITFNGEIYNYLELREELRAFGCEFHTGSDVEVLLNAYERWGIACLDKLIGMFAFALWDQERRRLWCVRDHMGIKPFYYVVTSDIFAFASEMKALRIVLPDQTQPDMAQLAWYLHFGLVYNPPHTFYEGIRELPGGHFLLIENGKVNEPIQWWDVNLERARTTYDLTQPDQELRRLLDDSVRLQVRSDVPVGTCLSGGLDSSAIVALSTPYLGGGSVNSFSSIYPVKGMDERRYIEIVAQRYQTIRHETSPTPVDYFARLEKITWHQDIPTATPTVYSQYSVMELAHNNVTVLLDGQGADEMFGGYLSYVVHHLRVLLRHAPARAIPELVAFLSEVRSRFNAALSGREFGYRVFRYLAQGNRPLNMLKSEAEALAVQRHAQYPARSLPGAEPVNALLYRALVLDSLPSLLHYEDRNSMAFSIEARVPFLDHRLVEFALALPVEHKIRGAETKRVLRGAMHGILPDEITRRRDKLGFPTPFSQWLRGELRAETESFLYERVLKRDWIEAESVRTVWQEHLSGQRDLSQIIHRLISAELWYAQTS